MQVRRVSGTSARNAVRSAAPALRVGRSRRSTVSVEARKVALLGAGGGIGQPLALLLKVAAYTGPDQLAACLKGAELVVIPAGVPRKPGMTRDDLFNVNAGIVKALVEAVAKNSPSAIIEIVTNPVNSTVPIAAETLKKAGCYDPRKVLGVTTLDV
ncbi:malate dehydrogenase, chloroplastic, partial [Haematococcus lacustris]